MKIPNEIHAVLNNRREFDAIYAEEMEKVYSKKDAFDNALDRIIKYAPHFNFIDYDTYRGYLSKRKNKGDVEVPKHIIYAVTKGIDNLLDSYIRKLGVRKMAYDATVKEINKYFPDYKPYKNYQSYKSSLSIRHRKKRIKRNRKNDSR